jgi:hypothetical protein
MNNKQRIEGRSAEARAKRRANYGSILKRFWSILELKIEEPGCKA